LTRAPEFGRIYANLGDLEFFVKDGNMQRALDYYYLAEQNGWGSPEIQYRMGAAHYQLHQWGPALDRFTAVHREITPNRRILYALGNTSYMRGNYFAAQGYYDRLLDMLNYDRSRLPPIMATDDESQLELAERLMVVQNNLAVTLEALTERTGNNVYRSRAHGLFADSERAWDILTRNPNTMIRMRPSPDITAPGINPAFLNIQNSLRPMSGFEPHFFLRIDRDMLEPSPWETLAPPGHRLSEGIHTGR
jgi:tetratricopeptide (TPR) repeat protein